MKTFFLATLTVSTTASTAICSGREISSSQLLATQELRKFLNDFHTNPKEVLNRLPIKKDANGNIVTKAPLPFPAETIDNEEYVEWRDDFRQQILTSPSEDEMDLKLQVRGQEKPQSNQNQFSINRPIGETDRPAPLIDDPDAMLRRPQDMEAQQLTSAAVAQEPWSDSYWPIAKGMLGSRYGQAGFPGTMDWPQNYAFFQSNLPSPTTVLADLSPAEKYDLIVGDPEYSLTKHMWKRGEQYATQFGKVPSWMGICHGWAAAAHMQLVPQQQVTIPSAINGQPVTFFISDIKGLLSGLWAGAMPSSRFMGGRCRVRSPARDDLGRISDPNCFDTNPGSWHLAIVNQLGKHHRSFVMDATYDFEVWNHPLTSYSYTYFNPQTLEPLRRAGKAIIPMSQFTIDKFKDSRSADAAYIVGINMAVTYITEMVPNHELTHRTAPRKTVNYVYDLELDANFNIIGGEWYLNRHPDFLWSFNSDAAPQSTGDRLLTGTWDGTTPVPQAWRTAAARSAKKGQILSHVVQVLLKLSRPLAPPTSAEGSETADNMAPGLH